MLISDFAVTVNVTVVVVVLVVVLDGLQPVTWVRGRGFNASQPGAVGRGLMDLHGDIAAVADVPQRLKVDVQVLHCDGNHALMGS